MALSDLRREMVLAAIAEFDQLGRDAFLKLYDYGRARDYFLLHDGKRYDSKAIAGVAHRGVEGKPMTNDRLSGGKDHAAGVLIRLGFDVTAPGEVIRKHSIEDLLRKVGSLKPAVSPTTGAQKRHQPLTLLWAIGRAAQGEPRLTPWEITYGELGQLIEEFGLEEDRPNPEFPVLWLYHHGLWDLPGHAKVPPASGRPAQQWMKEHRPNSGLLPWVHEIVTGQEEIRAQIAVRLLSVYFRDVDHNALLARVGLNPTVIRSGSFTPGRSESIMERVIRDSLLAEQIKRAHDYHCQICGNRLALQQGFYAEGAHIRPIGKPHNGPDEPDNLLCLCPNDHVLFDRGAIAIQADLAVMNMTSGASLGPLRLAPNHDINPEHLAYHRKVIAEQG
ncbi:HNH endonuclease [Streptosporangium sp. NPDC005286]|uniref:HNH endonuclease n=1 Tax=Streptosporangium sp. NPDC005286 TaxID=3154463 RepID=UPI0033AC144A